MEKKRHDPETIIHKLREAEVLQDQGLTLLVHRVGALLDIAAVPTVGCIDLIAIRVGAVSPFSYPQNKLY
jgi:hypothetical protein